MKCLDIGSLQEQLTGIYKDSNFLAEKLSFPSQEQSIFIYPWLLQLPV